MMGDLGTMLRKEGREFLLQGRSTKGSLLRIGFPVVVFGIVIPMQLGRSWVDGLAGLAMLGWVPLMVVLSMIADSFAGERERHTLETLLATRLSDQTILHGKIAMAVLYAWGLVVVALVFGLVTVNIAHGNGQLLMYPLDRVALVLFFSFLLSIFAATAGVLVSLRAASVRQAAQTLSLGFMGLIFGTIFLVRLTPASWRAGLASLLAQGSLWSVVGGAAAILIVLDLALLAAARVRFHRARLILD